jgi:hypothetical protein
VHALDDFARIFGGLKRELYMNTPNNEHAVYIFHFAASIRGQPAIACIDFARFQRASERAEHSPGGRSHNVIDSRGVGFSEFAFIDAVVFRDLIMDAELHRILLAW